MLAPGRRKSQPGTLPMRKLTSLTSCVAGAVLPWWTSRQTDGNAAAGESPGEAGDACAIPAIRAMWVVPSTGAARHDAAAAIGPDSLVFWKRETNHRGTENTEERNAESS